MRRMVPWFDLVVGVAGAGAGILLLAVGVDRFDPFGFLGWRTLLVGLVGALLARPDAQAWRDAAAGSVGVIAALGLFGLAVTTGDVARVGLAVVVVALCAAPLIAAGASRRMPGVPQMVGGLLGAATIALLGAVEGAGADLALAAAAGLCFAATTVLTDRVSGDRPIAGLVTAQLCLAGGVLTVAGGVLGGAWLPPVDTVALLVVTVFVTGVAAMLARWRAAEVLGPLLMRPFLPLEALAVVIVATAVGASASSTDLWAATAVGVAAAVAAGWRSPLAATEGFSAAR